MSKNPDESINVSEKFKKRIIELITEEDCTNAQFAERVGISKIIISNITNYAIIPSVKSLIKIADYLNVSLEYILCKSDDNTFIKSENPSTFQVRLLQLKEEYGLKFADISNQLSFSRNSMHVWLKRENLPTLDYLFQLADYFEVTPDYLLGRTDYRK